MNADVGLCYVSVTLAFSWAEKRDGYDATRCWYRDHKYFHTNCHMARF